MSWRRSTLVVTLSVATCFGGLFTLEGAGSAAAKPSSSRGALLAVAPGSVGVTQLVTTPDGSAATQSLLQAQGALDPSVAQTDSLGALIDAKVGQAGTASPQNVAAAIAVLPQLIAASDAAAARAVAVEAAANAIAAPAAAPATVCNCAGELRAVERARADLRRATSRLHRAAADLRQAIRNVAQVCARSPRSNECTAALRQVRRAVAAFSGANRDIGAATRKLAQAQADLARCRVRARLNPRCHPSGGR